jgi:hypothetical protein
MRDTYPLTVASDRYKRWPIWALDRPSRRQVSTSISRYAAPGPGTGALSSNYLATPEGGTSLLFNPDLTAGAIGDPAVLGASRTNWRSANPAFLAAAKAAYMAEGSDAEFFSMLNGLQPDESATVSIEDSRVEAHTWGRIKRTYIRHTLDRTSPIALQDRMIREADALTPHNRFDVHTVRTPHVPTTNGFQKIVRILDSLTAR